MKTKKYNFLTKTINQMNMNFIIKLVVLKSNDMVLEQMKVTSERVDEQLKEINQIFSPFKYDSTLSRFQRNEAKTLPNSEAFKNVYNAAILSEQMTNGIYRPYFAGRFDPSQVVKAWAVEEVFNESLKPLLTNPEIVAVYLSAGGNTKFATAQNSDFRWNIDVKDNESKNDLITTYYLKNGAMATVNNQKDSISQTTVIRSSLVEANIWAFVGAALGLESFLPYIAHYNLTGISVDQDKEIMNYNLGSIIKSKEIMTKK